MKLSAVMAGVSACVLAGAAHAQSNLAPPQTAAPVAPSPAKADVPPLDLSDARISIGARVDRPTGSAGWPSTALDRKFGPNATGSLGYLCGLQPGSDHSPGPTSSFGPVGTFLGAKLSYAFK